MRPTIRTACYLILTIIFVAGCDKGENANNGSANGTTKRPKVAYVTNGVASFWVIAESGVKRVAKSLTPMSRFSCRPKVSRIKNE